MKNITKVLALVLVLSMVCVIFASCGKTLSGKYQLDARIAKSGVVTTYEFSGNKYTLTVETYLLGSVTDTKTTEGTYEITENESGELQIAFTEEGEDEASTPLVLEEGEDSITIGIVTYKVVE